MNTGIIKLCEDNWSSHETGNCSKNQEKLGDKNSPNEIEKYVVNVINISNDIHMDIFEY